MSDKSCYTCIYSVAADNLGNHYCGSIKAKKPLPETVSSDYYCKFHIIRKVLR